MHIPTCAFLEGEKREREKDNTGNSEQRTGSIVAQYSCSSGETASVAGSACTLQHLFQAILTIRIRLLEIILLFIQIRQFLCERLAL